MSPRVVTLTTDFGHGDGFVAAMKGVILGLNSAVSLVDISHEIPPQDVRHAAFVLGTVCRYFPHDAIHLAVVDPGVGSSRIPILIETPHGTYIGPDNGIFSRVLFGFRAAKQDDRIAGRPSEDHLELAATPVKCRAYTLNKAKYWLEPLSDTFHGRDVFAPVVGHYAGGVSAHELGSLIGEVRTLPMPSPTSRGNVVKGQIIHVDRFGNLVSNIAIESPVGVSDSLNCRSSDSPTRKIEYLRSPPLRTDPSESLEVSIGKKRILGPSRSYESATGLLAIVGSHGFLEIAVRNGSAADILNAGVGTALTVAFLEGFTPEA